MGVQSGAVGLFALLQKFIHNVIRAPELHLSYLHFHFIRRAGSTTMLVGHLRGGYCYLRVSPS